VPDHPVPGRSLATSQAMVDLVRTATVGSYGVTGFGGRPLDRLLGRLRLARPGIVVRLDETLDIELDLTVAYGVPVAEVARQVDSAVRYAIRQALGREVRRITIHIEGLTFGPGGAPPSVVRPTGDRAGQRDLADRGTDVA
jgi:uncharacterized alkaline shock family protein YloU